MVLRDKSTPPPKLYFDNPLHTGNTTPPPPERGGGGGGSGDEDNGGVGGENISNNNKKTLVQKALTEKESLKESKSVCVNTNRHKEVQKMPSTLSHSDDWLASFFSSNSNLSSINPRPHSTAFVGGGGGGGSFGNKTPEIHVPQTPDSDFEDHIMENIRNRNFWSRSSRNNPFSRLRSSSRVRSYSGGALRSSLVAGGGGVRGSISGLAKTTSRPTSPNHLHPPLQLRDPDEVADGVEAVMDEEEEEEEAIIASEMMLEAQRETLLRENVVWMRNYLSKRSDADGGTFTLASFLATMRNKVGLGADGRGKEGGKEKKRRGILERGKK